MKNYLTIGKLFGKDVDNRQYESDNFFVLPKHKVGVEFEVEGVVDKTKLQEEMEKINFVSVHDGSLRNSGLEFNSCPIFGKDLFNFVNKAITILSNNGIILSSRCGFHVHLDMTHFTPNQIINHIIIYCIFEKVLFKYCGNNRQHNPFCIPLNDTYGQIYKLGGLITFDANSLEKEINQNKFRDLCLGTMRYLALNIAALHKHGTLEYRHAAMCLDINFIFNWINIIMSIHKASNVEYIINLPSLQTKEEYEQFAKQIFSHQALSNTTPQKSLYEVLGGLYIFEDEHKGSFIEDIIYGVKIANDIINYSYLLFKEKNFKNYTPETHGLSKTFINQLKDSNLDVSIYKEYVPRRKKVKQRPE